jgi:broad specificity phosphatase PhoE
MRKLATIITNLLIVLFCAQLHAQQAIILVRHAEDLRTGGTDRPLIEAGEKRAQQLAGHLKDSGITAIYTSALQRTINTALPTAKALRIESSPQSQLGTNFKPDDLNAFVDLLRTRHKSDVVLFVGHANTVPALIKALGHPSGIKILETEYDNLFVLIPKSEGTPLLLRFRY